MITRRCRPLEKENRRHKQHAEEAGRRPSRGARRRSAALRRLPRATDVRECVLGPLAAGGESFKQWKGGRMHTESAT